MNGEVTAMGEPDEEFDFSLVEPIPGLHVIIGDEDFLRIQAEQKIKEIRARKAAIEAAKREWPAS